MQAFGLARVGKDVEVRRTTGGDAVASVSLAFNYGRKDGDGKRPTQWVDAALWGERAEALAQYLTKGTAVVVTVDDLHDEEYEGRNGTGHKLVGRISHLEFAGGGQERSASPAPAPRQQSQQRRAPAPAPASGGGSNWDDLDESIPF